MQSNMPAPANVSSAQPETSPSAASSSVPAPALSAEPTNAPTTSPTATASPSGAISALWRIGDSYVLPSARDGQTQDPSLVNDSTAVDFSLNRTHNSHRNQMNPTDAAGNVFRLAAGTTYDWKFETVTIMPPDADGSRNVIWQIQDDKTVRESIAALGTQNMGDGGTVWYFRSGNRTWKGKYAQNATDNWEIQVEVASDRSGSAKLWRNGELVATQTGVTFVSSGKDVPSWNFGPYVPDWKASKLKSLDFVFNRMEFGAMMP